LFLGRRVPGWGGRGITSWGVGGEVESTITVIAIKGRRHSHATVVAVRSRSRGHATDDAAAATVAAAAPADIARLLLCRSNSFRVQLQENGLDGGDIINVQSGECEIEELDEWVGVMTLIIDAVVVCRGGDKIPHLGSKKPWGGGR
jgi:hypothetical protein